jgi:hypothetical protein
LTRASIFFAKSFYEEGWIAGSSPAMTGWIDKRTISFTALFIRSAVLGLRVASNATGRRAEITAIVSVLLFTMNFATHTGWTH